MFSVKSCEFVNISFHIVKFLGVGGGTADPYEVAGGWEGLYPIREPVGLAPPGSVQSMVSRGLRFQRALSPT